MEYLGPIEDKSWMDSKIHRAELQVRRTSNKVRLETRLKRRIVSRMTSAPAMICMFVITRSYVLVLELSWAGRID